MWQEERTEGTKRYGMLRTRKGVIPTPFFMPDATRASVRGLSKDDLGAVGVFPMVVNTYHLMLQPGIELIKKVGLARHATRSVAGGVHELMNYDGPLLSDSGGYQVYSLIHKNPELGRITEEGAEFRSPLDGRKHLLTPERSIEIQFDLGVDMMVCLDDPRPNDAPQDEIDKAVERTTRWALRCREEYDRQVTARGLDDTSRPLLFGVIQGGMSRELRKKSADGLVAIGFDGYGFGARHVDNDGTFLDDIISYTASLIPRDLPRFALGVGTPQDIVRCHEAGWDMFDCVIPTREGRHGRLFIFDERISNLPACRTGRESRISNEVQDSKIKIQDSSEYFYKTINITNEQYKEDFTPVDPGCDCLLCTRYTRAYLKHLFKVADPLAGRLASMHNLRFYMRLMEMLHKG